jgi:hypothetical protein
MNEEDDLDDDGYPTEYALNKIRNWDIMDFKGCMNYIFRLWNWESYRWTEEDQHEFKNYPVTRYYLSTGGWSGNESIIYALQENRVLWFIYWVQSRRGGHYIFECKKEEGQ